VPAEPWYPARVAPFPGGLRAFHPGDLHLTLAFLGACGEERARRALARCDEWSLGPVEVTLGALVPMGPPRRWSALSLLLEAGRERVEAELGRVREGWLEAAGARPERRPPLAHVTVARPRRSATEAERAAALAWARGLDVGAPRLTLGRPALYTWAEDRRERLFRIVERA
jgi:2'-5' RNA ligase